jgi:PhnB protein
VTLAGRRVGFERLQISVPKEVQAMVDPIPEGYPRLTPYLIVDGASDAIDFYTEVLGATERVRMPGDAPESIGHAEIAIGNSVIMLADEFPDMGVLGPKSIGGSPVTIMVYVEDVDAVFDKAVRAGARALEEPTDQFYGDRSGQFEDPFGHRWNIASHVEDVPAEEMQRRMAELSNE